MCQIVGCSGRNKAFGLCQKHYSRAWRGKDVEEKTSYDVPWEERFESKIMKNHSDPDYQDPLVRVSRQDGLCWMWPTESKSGYGAFYLNGKTLKAHRVSYELFVGDLKPGEVVDHLCRREACVNPRHLEAVTHRENIIRGNVRKKGDTLDNAKHGD